MKNKDFTPKSITAGRDPSIWGRDEDSRVITLSPLSTAASEIAS
jgi:hypothetical protein